MVSADGRAAALIKNITKKKKNSSMQFNNYRTRGKILEIEYIVIIMNNVNL